MFHHNGDNQLAVLGTRYGIWWPWYGQFEVGWLQPLQLWLVAGTSSVAPVLVSQDIDLCHVQLHPTWFESTSECRSWPVVSYLYSEHLPVGLYLGRGSLLLVGPLFHFRQCHSGLVPSRNEHVCPCHSMTRAGQNISGTGESESELGQHSLTNSTHRKVFQLAVSWLWHVLDWRLMSCPLVLPRTSLKHSLSMTWQSVFEDALWTP